MLVDNVEHSTFMRDMHDKLLRKKMLNCVSLALQFKTCHFCSSQKSLACEINDVCNVVAYITDHEELSCTKIR